MPRLWLIVSLHPTGGTMAFSIKGAARRTQAILKRGWLAITLVTCVTVALPTLGLYYGRAYLFDHDMDYLIVYGWFRGLMLATGPVTWLLHAFHMAAVTEIGLRGEAAKPIKAGQIALNGASNTIMVFVINNLLLLGAIAGAILLLVPGLVFAAAFSVAIPAYVCERQGPIVAFERSLALTKGHRVKIMATWLVIYAMVYTVSACIVWPDFSWIGVLFQHVFPNMTLDIFSPPPPVSPPVQLLYMVVRPVLTTLMMVMNVAIYLSLRFDTNVPVESPGREL